GIADRAVRKSQRPVVLDYGTGAEGTAEGDVDMIQLIIRTVGRELEASPITCRRRGGSAVAVGVAAGVAVNAGDEDGLSRSTRSLERTIDVDEATVLDFDDGARLNAQVEIRWDVNRTVHDLHLCVGPN